MYPLTLWSMMTHPFTSVVRDQMRLLHQCRQNDDVSTWVNTSRHVRSPRWSDSKWGYFMFYTLMTWRWRHHHGNTRDDSSLWRLHHTHGWLRNHPCGWCNPYSDDVRWFCLTPLRHVSCRKYANNVYYTLHCQIYYSCQFWLKFHPTKTLWFSTDLCYFHPYHLYHHLAQNDHFFLIANTKTCIGYDSFEKRWSGDRWEVGCGQHLGTGWRFSPSPYPNLLFLVLLPPSLPSLPLCLMKLT